MTTEPQLGVLRPPRTRIEGFSLVAEDGRVEAVAMARLHLMSDEAGQFPLGSLNQWERDIVLTELARTPSR
jgi:type III restriction enzyme